MTPLVIDSKVWWIAKPEEIRAPAGTPIVDAVKVLVERFQFAQGPQTIPGPSEGYKFHEGKITRNDRPIAIKELTIYNDGMSVEIYSSTDDARAAIEEFLSLGRQTGMRAPVTPPLWLYQSFITFELSESVDGLVKDFDFWSTATNKAIGVPGFHQLKVIEFAIDPKSLPEKISPFGATSFRIERKTSVDYSTNRYFSLANTSTENHLHLIGQLEERLAK